MKKLTLPLLASGIVILLLLLILKPSGFRKQEDDILTKSKMSEVEKQKVRTFWETYNLAAKYKSEGRLEDAITQYQAALEIDPGHLDSFYNLGNSLFELERYDEAIAVFKKLTQINPQSARGHYQTGTILSHLAPGAPVDLDAAQKEFEKNVRLNKEQSGPFYQLGKIALYKGDFQKAAESFNIVTKLNFKNVDAYHLLGYIEFKNGNYEKASEHFLTALEKGKREAPIKHVLSEGNTKDIIESTDVPDKKNLKSIFGLYWSTSASGGYPENVPKDFRIDPTGTKKTDAGLRFKTVTSVQESFEPNAGRGGAWGDYDKDGDLDLVICSLYDKISLYRNDGKNKFVDIAGIVGLANTKHTWDASWGDYDNDGNLDLYVICSGWTGKAKNFLFRNTNGKFIEVTKSAGLDGERMTAKASFVDLDNDGYLDLIEAGRGLIIYHNNADQTYSDETQNAGFSYKGITVDFTTGDYDNDGLVDIFAVNWNHPNMLYRNKGDGTFVDVTEQAGLYSTNLSYSAEFFDYNKDGLLDLLVTTYAPYVDVLKYTLDGAVENDKCYPTLYENNGASKTNVGSAVTFADVTEKVRLKGCYGTMKASVLDVDNDGFLDVYLANGGLDIERLEPDIILRNLEGKEFLAMIFPAGSNRIGKSLAVSSADYDNDGDIDIYVVKGGILPGDKGRSVLYVNDGN